MTPERSLWPLPRAVEGAGRPLTTEDGEQVLTNRTRQRRGGVTSDLPTTRHVLRSAVPTRTPPSLREHLAGGATSPRTPPALFILMHSLTFALIVVGVLVKLST